MRVWLGQELAASRIIELVQQVDYGRRMDFQLLQCHTGNGQSHLERTVRVLHHFNERIQGGNIRAFSNFIYTCLISIIIIVIMICTDIKETITFQMYNLMYLKIKTDSSH